MVPPVSGNYTFLLDSFSSCKNYFVDILQTTIMGTILTDLFVSGSSTSSSRTCTKIASGQVKLFSCFRQKTSNEAEALALIRNYNDLDTPIGIKDLVDTKVHDYKSLLQWAGIRGWKDICELLIDQYQCDPYYEDDNGWTVLHNVCCNGHIELVRKFASEPWNMDPLKITWEGGLTALDCSRKFSHPEITKYLESILPPVLCQEVSNWSGPTVSKMMKLLKHLVHWESFAIHLPGITKGSIEEIKSSKYNSVEQQKRALFTKWLYKSDKLQPVSWENVITALKSCEDNEFLKALSEGVGDLTHLNVMLDGPPGVGKTSLKRVILGKKPLPEEEQNSSDIMENAVRAVAIDRLKHFEVISNQDMIDLLADGMLKRLKETQQQISTAGDDEPAQPTRSTPVTQNLSSANESVSISPAVATSQTLLTLGKKFKDAKHSIDMFSSKWYHLIDSGGQPQFKDILPMVYNGPALQIVLMRLTEGLDDKPEMQYTENGQNVLTPDHSVSCKWSDHLQLTNRQHIENMCQIAASTKPTSRVMIVGTHKDKLGRNGKAKIEKLNMELKDMKEKYREVLILKSTVTNEVIFDLNTMATGEERKKYTAMLRKAIEEASSTKLANSTLVPLKWLVFHLDISNDTSGIVKIEDCYKSGEALGMKEGAVRNALAYLNRAALLLYYPDDFPNLVLTKVDPLVNKLSQLVKASFIPPPMCEYECDEFQKTGIFNKDFLEKISSEIALTNDEFLQLLLRLKITASAGGDEYFLPSALSFDPPNLQYDDACVPCGFSWGKRFLPHGFFFTVIVELIVSSVNGYSFEVSSAKLKLRQCRNQISVQEKCRKIPGVVTLTNMNKWIQVSAQSRCKRYCPTIFDAVNRAIQKAMEKFEHIGLHSMSPTVVSRCPFSGCSNHPPHYCEFTPDKDMFTCLVTGEAARTTLGMLCWTTGQKRPATQDNSFGNTKRKTTTGLVAGQKRPSSSTEDSIENTKRRATDTETNCNLESIISNVDDTTLSSLSGTSDLVPVLRAITSVINWHSLGLELGLEKHKLDKIQVDHHWKVDACQKAMVSLWLDGGEASWRGLVQALVSPLVDKRELAITLAKQHKL